MRTSTAGLQPTDENGAQRAGEATGSGAAGGGEGLQRTALRGLSAVNLELKGEVNSAIL
jgi:hypothetical protein